MQDTVYFVYPRTEPWPELFSNADGYLAPDSIPERLRSGPDCWTIQTYLRLKDRNLPVRLSSSFVPNCLNVVHADDLRITSLPIRSYTVAIVPDRPPMLICDLQVNQNDAIANEAPTPSEFIPLWPQPGLIKRDPMRPPKIRRVEFKGFPQNLDPLYQSPEFLAALKSRGVELVVDTDGWHDYEKCDLLLAVRDRRPQELLRTKPATKLYNAWLAGTPAALGKEPAFRELRESDLDYFESDGPKSVLEHIDKLNGDPELYRKIQEHGWLRGERFTVESISKQWEELLWGRALKLFHSKGPTSRVKAATLVPRYLRAYTRQRTRQKAWRASVRKQ